VNKRDLDLLMQKIQANDEDAFSELYLETYKGVFSFAYSFVHNFQNAEDIMQDVFIKIRRNIQSYKLNTNPIAWILQITKNLCKDFLKKTSKNCFIDEQEQIELTKDTKQTNVIDKLTILNAINSTLDVDARQIVILHILYGYKNREIAKFMEMPLGTVLFKYSKAIKQLKNKLEEDGR